MHQRLGLAVLLLLACKRNAAPDKTVDLGSAVVRVDDRVVTTADLEAHLKRLPPPVRQRYATPAGRKEMADNLVRFELLAGEGIRRGIDKRPEIQRLVKQQIINVLLQEEMREQKDGPSDDQVRKYYEENQPLFQRGDQVRVAHILVTDKATAAKVAVAARRVKPDSVGEFDKLVARYSTDAATKESGGDLGFFDRGSTRYSPTLVANAFSLSEVGATSDPVETEQGFHILRLTDKRAPAAAPFDEVKTEARGRLAQQQQDQATKSFIEQLRSKAKIEVFDDRMEKAIRTAAPPAAPTPSPPR